MKIQRLFLTTFFIFLMVTSFTAAAKVHRYISIDGGGMLGLIPLHLLLGIEEETGVPISKLVNGMMGTSTGAIISSLLATPAANRDVPFSAAEVVDFYQKRGVPIFNAAMESVIKNQLGKFLGHKPDFSAAANILQSHIDDIFKDIPLSRSLCDLYILSHDKSARRMHLFDSSAAQVQDYLDLPLGEIVRASTSIADAFGPTPIKMKSGETQYFVDAGSMGVMPPVTDPTPYLYQKLAQKLASEDSAIIYSLGTGFSKTSDATRQLMRKRGNISIIRIQPKVEHLIEGIPGTIGMNLLSANTRPEKLQQMIKVAAKLKSSPGYQRMLADFKAYLTHDEL